ncbi:hypothetical protein [Pseudomonas aeruginosa]|uniref:hypothetical protein n=1 Tax=Pseudomonas aeruginosa TaxID=287 RepID=UPI003D29AAE0
MSTAQQRLDEVRVAIQDILKKGQSVRKGDRQVDRAQLASLRVLEQQYAEAAALEAATKQPPLAPGSPLQRRQGDLMATRYRITSKRIRNSYEGAGTGRRAAGWDAPEAALNAVAIPALPTLRKRSRAAVRNDPYAARRDQQARQQPERHRHYAARTPGRRGVARGVEPAVGGLGRRVGRG